MTDGFDLQMEQSTTLDSNGKYILDSRVLDILSEGPTNVIPLLITRRSKRVAAWNAGLLQSFKSGSIRRIFLWLDLKGRGPMEEDLITSSARGIFRETSVACSVVSQSKQRALICGFSLLKKSSSEEQSLPT